MSIKKQIKLWWLLRSIGSTHDWVSDLDVVYSDKKEREAAIRLSGMKATQVYNFSRKYRLDRRSMTKLMSRSGLL